MREKIIDIVLYEEGRPPESIFDFVQGITAHGRTKAHQDSRLKLEGRATALLEKHPESFDAASSLRTRSGNPD